jgi:His-Xaa-Ser system radical SAM maturase HxsB
VNIWPLRFRATPEGRLFFADDAGGYFVSDESFLGRYARGALSGTDRAFLTGGGHAYERAGDLAHTGFAWRWTARQCVQDRLSYVILVPTLRCNLACSYCQVSRAAETARGYDWTAEILDDALRLLGGLDTDEVKIEFQGGEPLLRLDLLDRVRTFCRERFDRSSFVVCTNLQRLGNEELAFLDAEDTLISTSLDGRLADHDRHRTQDRTAADTFFANLAMAIGRFGPARVSALPTVDLDDPPDFDALIDVYESFGLSSIYLRPVNYQGFARRRAPRRDDLRRWNEIYGGFIDRLIDRNFRTGRVMEEFYFSHSLRRVLQAGHDGHVDLRNPSLPAADYIVVDFDGRLYPSDEARMLARIGHIDLSIGTAAGGIDRARTDALLPAALNNFDPDCIHCPYQPYCGSDPVDEISRHGRVDLPRADSWFCGRQLFVFDRAVELMYGRDEKALFSLRHWAGLASWPAALTPVHHDTAAPAC